MPTLLCVPIMVHDDDAALRDAREAQDAGADLVEFRVDEIFSGGEGDGDEHDQRRVLRLVAESPLPCIVTCRPAWEGGHYDGDEAARIALFERLGTAFGPGEHPPRYIDVELAAYTRSANIRQKINLAVEHPEQVRDLQTSLILSTHDFQGLPADLSRRVLRMQAEPAAKVLKIAFRARSLRDNLELFDLLARRDRPTIALGMGEFGLMSRVLAPKFGGFVTFASLRPQSTTAPGQPTVREVLDTYRFRAIGPSTAVYGVVGWPVAHSLSPHVHNAGFEAVGHDGVYLPLPIPTLDGGAGSYENFKATVVELLEHPGLTLRGCSVTIPHKENLLRLAREQGWAIDSASARIGAANTLTADRRPDGSLAVVRVSNTDGPALASSLREAVGELAGLKVAVLGAGGAGRAAASALADEGAAVTVYNRDPVRAAALAAELTSSLSAAGNGSGAIAAAPLDEISAFRGGVIVNCTPVGMAHGPTPDASPVPFEVLRDLGPGAVVFDTVYTPIRTPLLRAAEKAGLRAIDGVGMFVRQAAAQFQEWTGSHAPSALFDRIARERLGAQGT